MSYQRNRYSNGLDYDVRHGTVKGFMRSHNKKQRLFEHAILHSPSSENLPKEKRKTLHDAIVRRDLKGGMAGHKTPINE